MPTFPKGCPVIRTYIRQFLGRVELENSKISVVSYSIMKAIFKSQCTDVEDFSYALKSATLPCLTFQQTAVAIFFLVFYTTWMTCHDTSYSAYSLSYYLFLKHLMQMYSSEQKRQLSNISTPTVHLYQCSRIKVNTILLYTVTGSRFHPRASNSSSRSLAGATQNWWTRC